MKGVHCALSLCVLTLGLLAPTTACSGRPSSVGLRMGIDYVANLGSQELHGPPIYRFDKQRVSVSCVVRDDHVVVRTPKGEFIGYQGAVKPKGTQFFTAGVVVLGPGDRMPVLENAPYNIDGISVLVDWSQGHSQYLSLTRSNSGSEVFTIKNNGLILESAIVPGFVLTLDASGR